MNHVVRAIVPLLTALAASVASPAADRERESSSLLDAKLPIGAIAGVTPSQVRRALIPTAATGTERLSVNAEISRGLSANVYPRVSPAIVLVHTGRGHGTGFLISEDGWGVTNAHVVESAAIRLVTGVPIAKVFLGHVEDGIMVLDEPAIVTPARLKT